MKRLDELRAFLLEHAAKGIALAFSGGVDSSLLLAVLKSLCVEHPFPLVALTMHSIFQRPEELTEVRTAASNADVELNVFECDPLSVPEVMDNPPDRCYWCKRAIFQQFRFYADSRNIAVLIDGTNADDRKTYRPGLAALAETNVLSPLAELGFSKREIREAAAFLHLDCAGKPSVPCMATRFEYGTHLTEALLRRTAAGEDAVRRFLPSASDVRLRVHGTIARIEVGKADIARIAEKHAELSAELKKAGFEYVTLDLEGFRSGSMDIHCGQKISGNKKAENE